jgi:hypothetical protein
MGLLLTSDIKECNLHATFLRLLAQIGTPTYIELVSCDFEPSLRRHDTDMEN